MSTGIRAEYYTDRYMSIKKIHDNIKTKIQSFSASVLQYTTATAFTPLFRSRLSDYIGKSHSLTEEGLCMTNICIDLDLNVLY